MKCVHCGQELKEGSLFCSNCGKEVQIVPDYNVYDEDYLKQVIKEENRPAGGTPQSGSQPGNAARQKKKKMYIILGSCAALLFVAVVALVVGLGVKNKRAGSFDYQMQMAQEAYEKGNIESAIEYYENALALDADNIEVRLILASIYMERKDYDSVMILCQEVIQMENSNQMACEMLISIYENQKNYDAILALREAVSDSLKDLFAVYEVTPPLFSQEPGTYEEFLSIALTADGEYEIYYSLDGSDPTLRGLRYGMPIELDENQKIYRISAVCMNDKGLYSEVVTNEYQIDIPAPAMPIVTPNGGDFGVETTVTITVPDGCSAYYTWDGSDPGVFSARYTGPITIPEGNNVLSVIIVDNETGLISDIFRGNYIFYPEGDEGETLPEADEEEEAGNEKSVVSWKTKQFYA
ncbi:MAG: chitobiase/beta-hexosaminidase C-terminal domain-containing protein [Blautia sp.]|nr:chitobiase/beta-hexosaminidase C-terminal domain-containing protein [Blautia sp.]